ncbi:hypothetical protein TNCV_587821 [Trichonephila clavipes]|nr:hypothetical protein TNCV_587821 [Trichonephila clavipes]
MAGEAVSLHSLLANRNCKIYRQNFEADDFPSGAVNLFKGGRANSRGFLLLRLPEKPSTAEINDFSAPVSHKAFVNVSFNKMGTFGSSTGDMHRAESIIGGFPSTCDRSPPSYRSLKSLNFYCYI